MTIETAWLSGAGPTSGLDQLGIRATAVRMYGHLVPGITNQTDRARYLALHPYVVHGWASGTATTDKEAFQSRIRRTECVLATAERIRAIDEVRAAPGITGRVRIDRWLREQHRPLRDEVEVPLDLLEHEYFGNKWGGFGQYYSGPEEDLGLISWKDGLPRLVDPLGQRVATVYASGAGRCGLAQALAQKRPTVGRLRRIADELGFDRCTGEERDLLLDVLLDRADLFGAPGLRRRNTMLLLLFLADQSPHGLDEPDWQVLEAAAHGRSAPGVPFASPAALVESIEAWRTYALHEYFASALEAVLAVAVSELRDADPARTGGSVDEIAASVADRVPATQAPKSFGQLMAKAKDGLALPALDPSTDAFDERTLRQKAIDSLAADRPAALFAAFGLLARVAARVESIQQPYSPFVRNGMQVDGLRLGLDHLRRIAQEWSDRPLAELVRHIATLVVNTHLRVATAKLAYSRIFTFKVVFDHGRLCHVQDVEVAFSSPRLRTAASMMADLGLLRRSPEGYAITTEGRRVLALQGRRT